jgi:hypothetical protein
MPTIVALQQKTKKTKFPFCMISPLMMISHPMILDVLSGTLSAFLIFLFFCVFFDFSLFFCLSEHLAKWSIKRRAFECLRRFIYGTPKPHILR